MALPDVDPESLNLWVFGPGYGELVIVRAPPGQWLVVDGCGNEEDGYARRALDHYKATPALILFSHPHKDHAKGLRAVIERATGDPDTSTWPRIGMVPAPDTTGVGDPWDATAALDAGLVQQVVATIHERWRQHAPCRWELGVGTSERLGDATVRVLSPTDKERDAAREAWLANRQHNYNRAASALLITWRGRRVLLGSDLEETSGRGWTAAMSQDADLRRHDVYKIAHHGSKNAVGPHVECPSAPQLRVWIVTPFSKAFKGLPRFDDGEGLARLLRIEDSIDLTGLPREHERQSGQLEDRLRTVLRDDRDQEFATSTSGFPDCWVHIRVPSEGVPEISRGPGSVRVRE